MKLEADLLLYTAYAATKSVPTGVELRRIRKRHRKVCGRRQLLRSCWRRYNMRLTCSCGLCRDVWWSQILYVEQFSRPKFITEMQV